MLALKMTQLVDKCYDNHIQLLDSLQVFFSISAHFVDDIIH